jgi:beta-glucosidase
VLYGDVNPAGHLPYTIAKKESDYKFADITNSSALLNTKDPNAWQSNFNEHLLIDYRHFDYYNESVQYEFGFGLSYTTFSMSDISITQTMGGRIPATAANATIQPGGLPGLWDVLYTVSATVSNTGSCAGYAVPQLYLGLPQPADDPSDPTPVQVLRGFDKVLLQPAESQTITFPLMRRDVSYWDIGSQQWVIGDGGVRVYAGFSSRDIRATSSFSPLSGHDGGK